MPSPSTPKRAGTASGHVPRSRIRIARITATVVDGGLQTDGTQLWCSGGHLLDRALAAAHREEGYRLFGVRLDASGIETRITWQGVGMHGSDTVMSTSTEPVDRGAPVGPPGWH